MAAVGRVLDQSTIKETKAKIAAWLDEHESCCVRLLQLMEAGLVHQMLDKHCDKTLPRSCIRIGLVAQTIKSQSLRKAQDTQTTDLLKIAKAKDANIEDKLFYMHSGWETATPMKGGPLQNDFTDFWLEQGAVLGNRLRRVVVASDGTIDWSRYGVYFLAKVYQTYEGLPDMQELPASECHEATHVVHRYSEVAVTLKALGLEGTTASWSIIDNWHEQRAALSNGMRIKVAVWHDIKEHSFFNYAERHQEQYPNSKMSSCIGCRARLEATKHKDEAHEAMHEAKEKAKLAGMSGAAASMAAPFKSVAASSERARQTSAWACVPNRFRVYHCL